MTDTNAEMLTTADGRPLKAALASAQSHAKWRAFFLVAPLLAFICITFVSPIAQMLLRSVYNPSFSEAAPSLVAWFDEHPQGSEIDESAYAALAADLKLMKEQKTPGSAGTRINYDVSGSRSMFTGAARKADGFEPPYKEAILAVDKGWDDPMLWRAMRSASATYTADFYLAALDRTRDENGDIIRVDENRRIYVTLFQKTLMISALITVLCLILAYPIAHLLAILPLAKSNLLMIFVLLPFWTSLLVRTTSWIVLLQSEGVVNNVLVALGIIGPDGRIQMIYNQMGTIIAMTHILLPFMVLPLYSVMRPINPSYVRAARVAGRHKLDRVPPGIPAADGAGHRGRGAVGLHPGGRLLHHARPGRRLVGAADFQPHRLPHAEIAELVAGGRAGGAAAGQRPDPLLAV